MWSLTMAVSSRIFKHSFMAAQLCLDFDQVWLNQDYWKAHINWEFEKSLRLRKQMKVFKRQ